jgi:rfaE bifunctional protein nucleotidyltransferase chain/domain
MLNGLQTQEELLSQVTVWRTSGQEIGFTCGAFDLLHAGHIDYLQKARGLCDRLIVAVNSDVSIRSYKDPMRPIISEKHRLSLVASLSCVDAAILMDDTRPARLIELLRPDLYIKGGDYQPEQLRSASIVESYGGRCILIAIEHEISTSAIISRIQRASLYAPVEHLKSPAPLGIVFLDRDGTLIENVPFLKDPYRVKLLPGVGEGLRLLQDHGFRLVVVTNQQGLGLGYFDYDAFTAVNSEMLRQLATYGVRVSKFYFCPHSFAENCTCRKPGTQLIERALRDFECNAEQCYLLGDSTSDMEAAAASGCKGFLLGAPSPESSRPPFLDAVQQILSTQVVVLANTPPGIGLTW